VAKLAQDEAITISMEAKTSKMLKRELATLEFQVRQSVRQASVDKVGLFIAIPTMPSQLSFWVLWLLNYCVFP
jgi:hypothetical protein